MTIHRTITEDFREIQIQQMNKQDRELISQARRIHSTIEANRRGYLSTAQEMGLISEKMLVPEGWEGNAITKTEEIINA